MYLVLAPIRRDPLGQHDAAVSVIGQERIYLRT
jgi:hypothetical protein